MSVLPSTLRWDTRLQGRYGIVAAAVVVTLAWVAMLWAAPRELRSVALPLVLFGDTAIFGFYLFTGLLFLERGDGVLDALVVTPLGWQRYLLGKILPLTGLTLLIGVVLTLGLYGAEGVHWLWLLLGLGLTAPLMMLLGFVMATRFRSISEYIMPSALLLTVAQLPAFDYLGFWQPRAMDLLPTQANLSLLGGALRGLTAGEAAYGVGYSLLALAVAWWAAGRAFQRFVAGGAPPRRSRLRRGAARGSNGRGNARRSDPRRDEQPAAGISPSTAVSTDAARGGRWRALASLDLRNVAREPIMAFLAVYSVVLAVVARWLLPIFAAWLDGRYGVVLADYQALATSTFVVLTNPMILGAVVGLLLLDEQDEGSMAALRVTPLGMARYVAWRTATPVLLCMAFSFASVVIVAPVFEAPPPGPVPLLAVAFLAALGTPLMALAVASVAGNKVEGLAIIKGLGFLIMAAFVAWWAPWPWRWLFGIFPTWWPTEAYWRFAGEPGPGGPWLVWALGLAVHAALLWALGRRFVRRV